MIVRVVPKRPIPGILPKNKWIDIEMELDLNEKEIKRCMQYGDVYFNGEIIDEVKLISLSFIKPEKKIEYQPTIETTELEGVLEIDKPSITVITPVFKQPQESAIVEEKQETIMVNMPDVVEVINKLTEVSCVREDNYIILELQFNTNSVFNYENVIGMFKVNSGSKIEYKSDSDKWVKFNHKFNTFEKLENETKFVFRFNPSHKSLLKYHLTLKQEKENGIEVNLDGTIDQANL